MRDLLYKVADVLEAQAVAEDARAKAPPVTKQAAEAPKGPNPIEKIAATWRDRTGEELPADLQEKLNDPSMADFVVKMAGIPTGRMPLGEAHDVQSAASEGSKADRIKGAYDKFGTFLSEPVSHRRFDKD